ncbi:MAG TPA: glycosyltransferase family 4 protein, partial [Thermoanaerobaculia bacterium]
MRVSFLSPLPPAKTGVAHYAAMLLPALRQGVDLDAFDSPPGYRAGDYDAAIYQLGNNPHHAWVYAEAMRVPGVVVLHDLVLHHLIVEMTLARGDAEGYAATLTASHGEMGAAWAWGRAAGLHSEMGNFLLPASIELANRSRAVIVHNAYAADRLRSFGVATPIHVIPHPYLPEPPHRDRDEVRARLGLEPSHRAIGLFGFLTSAKRAEVVVEAFRIARERNRELRLLIVGEPAPNIDLTAIAGEGIITTGYVSDEDFPRYYAAIDRLVNLRYPSAGETSGTLIRGFDAGKPVAVSDYAQFAEFPDDCVTKIRFGEDEAGQLARFFLDDVDEAAIARAQRHWLEANARLELTVDGYMRVLADAPHRTFGAPHPAGVRQAIPLFPRLTLTSATWRNDTLALTIRNAGDSTLRTRTYGEPGYRLIAILFDDDRVVQDRWLELPRDVAPG